MRITLNDRKHRLEVDASLSAIAVLCDELRLVCATQHRGRGDRGSGTVFLDGEAIGLCP